VSAIQREVTIGPCRLIQGDCLDVLPMLGKVDAVVTDPPYGVNLGKTDGTGGKHGLTRGAYLGTEDTYPEFVSMVVPRISTAIRIAKRAAVFTGPHIHEQDKPDAIGGVYCSAACGRHSWGFKNFLPVLLYGVAPDLQFGAKYPTAIASNATAKENCHPCPKPLEWMEWLVLLASRDAEVILDPFMGSGTTGVACIRTDRQFIGIEKEPKYFDIACKRITDAWQLKCSELPFDDVPKLRQRELVEAAQ